MRSYTKSKSSLFLMEFIIILMLFAVCAAICMQLFAATDMLSRRTTELNKSVAVAQSFVEVMRSEDGEINSMLKYYPEAIIMGESNLEIFYDSEFVSCGYSDADYICEVALSQDEAIVDIEVRVSRIEDSECIYTLEASKYIAGNR